VIEWAGKSVERAAGLDALAIKLVVFDEAQQRGLIGERVVDEVALGEWRDQQERHARAIAATAVYRLAESAVQRRRYSRLALLGGAGIADARARWACRRSD